MAAIPVPVHFDGHNINIITEDSPSTCKNRTKGVNYGKKNNNKNKKRNKIQQLNKRLPGSSTTPTDSTPKVNNSSDTPKEMPTDSNTKENISPSGQQIDELNPPQPAAVGAVPIKKPSCPLPIIPPPQVPISHQPIPIINKPLPSLPLPPPPIPGTHQHGHGHGHGLPPVNMNNMNALNHQSATQGQGQPQQPTKEQIIAQQNKQLIHNGLDPNEFGSHDDIGFDDENNKNNRNGNGKDRQNLYKTELCREWSTSGWCYYNKRCSFAHGLQELRPVFRSKKWRTKRCRNWHTTGYCPYEHRCQFLHDQSPPRRISDYATANARALVAAQQRMQPLYFHYQVDCNRDDTSDDDGMDKKSLNNSKPNTPTSPRTRSLGPRFKSKKLNKKPKTPKTPKTPQSNGSTESQNNNIRRNNINGNPMGQIRMIPQRKNHRHNNALKIGRPQQRNKSKGKNRNKNKLNNPKTPNTTVAGGHTNNFTGKPKKKKPKKDAVITPFNPVSSNTYPTAVNINNIMGNQNKYEIAAQQLGLYNPNVTLPNMQMNNNIAAAAAAMGGIIPPLPMSTIPTAFQTLPPSIDPSLYLSLTPSPPQSPHTASTNAKSKKKRGNNKLAVEVPVSLTPSPPSLPTAPIHPIHLNSNTQSGINAAGLSHQQIGLELVKQQQTLQALHEKVQQVAQQQAAQQAEQQAAVQALLARNVLNKSQTPIAPIDGGLLESLLPTNDDENKGKSNEKNGNKSSQPKSAPNNNEKQGNNSSENGNKSQPKSLPPIPPIPPPLQLQTSINSVVTGAVAAAIMNSAPNTNINANIANTNIKQQAPNIGFNNNNINVNVAVNNNNNSNNNSGNNNMYYSHHQPQQIPLQQLQQLQPMTTHIGYPPFYAPSPDFQEIPQQQYYNANYTHHQVQRHPY